MYLGFQGLCTLFVSLLNVMCILDIRVHITYLTRSQFFGGFRNRTTFFHFKIMFCRVRHTVYVFFFLSMIDHFVKCTKMTSFGSRKSLPIFILVSRFGVINKLFFLYDSILIYDFFDLRENGRLVRLNIMIYVQFAFIFLGHTKLFMCIYYYIYVIPIL